MFSSNFKILLFPTLIYTIAYLITIQQTSSTGENQGASALESFKKIGKMVIAKHKPESDGEQ